MSSTPNRPPCHGWGRSRSATRNSPAKRQTSASTATAFCCPNDPNDAPQYTHEVPSPKPNRAPQPTPIGISIPGTRTNSNATKPSEASRPPKAIKRFGSSADRAKRTAASRHTNANEISEDSRNSSEPAPIPNIPD